MKKYLLLLMVVSIVFAPKGVNSLEEQLTSLPQGGLLQADITQSRYLEGLPEPIVSEGTLKLIKGKGLIWAIKKPFPSTMVLTPKGLFQLENGQKREQTALQQRGLFSTLSSVFSGNFNKLPAFSISSKTQEKTGWSVTLHPKTTSLLALFKSIKIHGNIFIDKIILNRANQDKDVIFLHNQVMEFPPLKASSLSKQEKKWLQYD